MVLRHLIWKRQCFDQWILRKLWKILGTKKRYNLKEHLNRRLATLLTLHCFTIQISYYFTTNTFVILPPCWIQNKASRAYLRKMPTASPEPSRWSKSFKQDDDLSVNSQEKKQNFWGKCVFGAIVNFGEGYIFDVKGFYWQNVNFSKISVRFCLWCF